VSSRVVVVSTGGTIAMRPDPASGKLVPAVSGDELVEMLDWPEAPPLELDDFAQVPSFDVHGELALRLARRAVEHAVAGIPTVVTHGTDTMEESAYLTDLLLPDDAAPVVFTGAQRGAGERDADGPRNLRDAITAAVAAESAGLGVLIAFAGELHAAREARKVHTSALRAFASPGYGPVGHVDAGKVRVRRRPIQRPGLPVPERMARVDLIRLHAGSEAHFLLASLAAGAEAIVLEGTGRGNANDQVVEGVRQMVAAGILVVVCSRCAEGAVEPVYGRGGGRDLAEAGALFAGDLAGPKARVLLQVAIGGGVEPEIALAAAAG
jgi:L-asparaginase